MLLKASKNILLYLLLLLLAEALYFNILYDLSLVSLLLIQSLAIGSYVPVRSSVRYLDKALVQLASGLGISGFGFWLLTLHNPGYKSSFLLISLLFIAVRRWQLLDYYKHLGKHLALIANKNRFLFPTILIFLFFYIIAASYPIWQWDALAKHIAIPFKILTKEHWDYNIIEFIGYGDYALLSHMFYLYLLALGGTKALALFNVAISMLLLFQMLRLASSLSKSRLMVNLITIVYLTTPLIHMLSTTIYVDLLPLYFVFAALLFIKYLGHNVVVLNIFTISFLCGCAFFAKQQAAYYILPIALLVTIAFIQAFRRREHSLLKLSNKLVVACMVFFLPFLPAMLIIWYKTGNPLFPFMNGTFKSEYFVLSNFVDPFNNSPLGLNLHSIFSMIFETGKNIEMAPGGLGIYLLGLFLLPVIMVIKRRDKLFLLVIFLMISSYYIATIFTYNLRYMAGSFALAIIIVCYTIANIVDLITQEKIRLATGAIVGLLLVLPGIVYLIHPSNGWGYKMKMLSNNSNLVINANESVLSSVNRNDVKILSNNDAFRGTFNGSYYVMSWHNQYLLQQLNDGKVLPAQFMKFFDYYLVDKRVPAEYPQYLSLNKPEISSLLSPFMESDSHILYRINHAKSYNILLAETFAKPLVVRGDNSEIRSFSNTCKEYRINLGVAKPDPNITFTGRIQINWLDSKGRFFKHSAIPFILDKARSEYESPVIDDIPDKAKSGSIYLISHDKNSIEVISIKVLGIPKNDYLQNSLDKYNEKLPHLAR